MPELSRRLFLACSATSTLLGAEESPNVQLMNAPNGGLQPQAAVDSKGVVHLIYLQGDSGASDIYYVRKSLGRPEFNTPIRVNDRPGSAIALGTVRGAHLSIGRSDRVHVAWNGSSKAEPKGPWNSAPMLYTRMNDQNTAFEPQRSVMTTASGLDGGGTLAADQRGNVYVAWHAHGQQNGQPLEGEGHRRVWLARSMDDGKTFGAERPISPGELGACGCCGMGAVANEGVLYLLYRSARETLHRDMYLLTSRDKGRTFSAIDLQHWDISACPMSTVSLTSGHGRVLLSWETEKQVYFASVDTTSQSIGRPIPAPGVGSNRKHPAVAVNQKGQTLLVWTEGTGWKRGGSLAWQMFDKTGNQLAKTGAIAGLSAWNFATAVAVGKSFLLIS